MATTSQELAASAAGVDPVELGQKVRVHALAKALGIPSAQMITVLAEHGLEGKRATSTVPQDDVARVLGELTAAGAPAEKKEKAPATKRARKPAKKAAAKKAPAGRAPAKKSAPAPEKAESGEPTEKSTEAPAAASRRRSRSSKVTRSAGAPEQPAADVAEEEVTTSVVQPTGTGETGQAGKPTASSSSRRRRRRTTRPSGEETRQDRQPEKVQQPETVADQKQTAQPTSEPKREEAPEAPEATEAPEAPKEAADKSADTPAERPAGTVVRRRIVRRVGSRSAAAGAEALRKERQEQQEQNAGAADSSEENRGGGQRRRRGSRGRGRGRGDQQASSPENQQENREPKPPVIGAKADKADKAVEVVDEPVKLKGSTRLESKRRWREEQGHEKHRSVTRAEFLARRENIFRSMVVRDAKRHDGKGWTTQVGVVEDGLLVEHFVASDARQTTLGNIYLGRVQNVLSSMEAAFIDIGTGRNAVLYASEVDWRSPHIRGRSRRIDSALKQGDQVLVQVTKEPVGHKGARLTNRVSFAGRYLVYVPGGRNQGISRKLPESERKRLKGILQRVVPEDGGTIIRTAAEGVSEEKIAEDVDRLHRRWVDITEREEKERDKKGAKPVTLYEEPNLLVKVVRDMFNEDFNELVVDGKKSWQRVHDYVHRMAPDLEDRVVRWDPREHDGADVFAAYELDDQLANALSRKIWLPSGGYLIIDKTEAMTVIDVNTGSFVGSGGNLEETVTKNNLEAAEEIVRQMRLRDIGGMIVVDFVDMVLEENRDLLLRRLTEYLASDRTRHKVSEVTSLGLVQMTRKRLGDGLVETYSTPCEVCDGRGIVLHEDPVDTEEEAAQERRDHGGREGLKQARHEQEIRRRYEESDIADAPAPAQEQEGQDDHSTAEVARAVHGAAVHGDEADDDPDSVQSIVAHALSRAGAEDPDEPTGADYVADEPEDAEDTAAAEPAQAPAAGAAGSPSKRRSRRGRRRRVVRRVVPEAESAPATADPVTEEPEVTEDTEVTADAPEPAAEPAQAAGGYREAKEEFDRSPRRRRKVRGNSRSDVAPRPEDYGDGETPEPQAAQEPRKSQSQKEQPRKQQAPAPQVRSDRRGRRRVVRPSN